MMMVIVILGKNRMITTRFGIAAIVQGGVRVHLQGVMLLIVAVREGAVVTLEFWTVGTLDWYCC